MPDGSEAQAEQGTNGMATAKPEKKPTVVGILRELDLSVPPDEMLAIVKARGLKKTSINTIHTTRMTIKKERGLTGRVKLKPGGLHKYDKWEESRQYKGNGSSKPGKPSKPSKPVPGAARDTAQLREAISSVTETRDVQLLFALFVMRLGTMRIRDMLNHFERADTLYGEQI